MTSTQTGAGHLVGLLTDTAAPAVPAAQGGHLALSRWTTGSVTRTKRHFSRGARFTARRFRSPGYTTAPSILKAYGVSPQPWTRVVGTQDRPFRYRSPDRWVLAPASEDIHIAAARRPRVDVSAWADERARLPIDPEWGPGWHLSVLPLEGGPRSVWWCRTQSSTPSVSARRQPMLPRAGRTISAIRLRDRAPACAPCGRISG